MTSEDVIYLKSILLSSKDPRTLHQRFHPGDKFILKELDSTFSQEIISLLEGQRVILEILGYALTTGGEIVYDMQMIEINEELAFRWLLSEQELEESFIHLGDDFQQARFVFIDV